MERSSSQLYVNGWDWIGWLSYILGSLRAPSVLMKGNTGILCYPMLRHAVRGRGRVRELVLFPITQSWRYITEPTRAKLQDSLAGSFQEATFHSSVGDLNVGRFNIRDAPKHQFCWFSFCHSNKII